MFQCYFLQNYDYSYLWSYEIQYFYVNYENKKTLHDEVV